MFLFQYLFCLTLGQGDGIVSLNRLNVKIKLLRYPNTADMTMMYNLIDGFGTSIIIISVSAGSAMYVEVIW